MPNGCASAEENFTGPKMGHSGHKRGQDEVVEQFLGQNLWTYDNFAYNGWQKSYAVPNGCASAEENFAGPKMDHLGP